MNTVRTNGNSPDWHNLLGPAAVTRVEAAIAETSNQTANLSRVALDYTLNLFAQATLDTTDTAMMDAIVGLWQARTLTIGAGTAVISLWEAVGDTDRTQNIGTRSGVVGLAHAALHVKSHPGVDYDSFIEYVSNTVDAGANDASDTFLSDVITLTAWRAGLAHLRAGGVAAAQRLDSQVVLAATGLRRQTVVAIGDDRFAGLASGTVVRVGGHAVFNGRFRGIPRLAAVGDRPVVTDGVNSWWVHIDRFGTTFEPANHDISKLRCYGADSYRHPGIPGALSVLELGDVTLVTSGRSYQLFGVAP